jgi:hypothetical protein
VGVEPTGDRKTCRPPVLKITQPVLTGYENSLLYRFVNRLPEMRSDPFCPTLTHLNMEVSRFYQSSFRSRRSPPFAEWA